MAKESGITRKLDEGFVCECGQHHEFGAWVAAHWEESLLHTCPECGRKHTLRKGRIKLIGDPWTQGRV